MFEKPQSSQVLGLDIDAFSLKCVLINRAKNKLKIEKFFDFQIEKRIEGEDVKLLYTTPHIEQLNSLTENQLIVTAAATSDILTRPLELKLFKEKDIEAALPFQTEPLLPYPIESAVLDKVLLSKSKEGSKFTVFSIRKDHLDEHIKGWQSLEIEPEVVSAAPQALVLFANQFINIENPFFILYLGFENSFGILVDQKKLVAAQAIPSGINDLVKVLLEEKNIGKLEAVKQLMQQSILLSAEKHPALRNAIEELRMTITRTLYSLAKSLKGKDIQELFVAGPGTIIPELKENFSSVLNKTLVIPNHPLDLGVSLDELLNYALPIGQALSALPGSQDQINFRQNEFAYPEPWKRLKQPLLFYFLLCLGIATALFIFGTTYTSYREGELRQEYLNLLKMMNKSYSNFEKEAFGKTTSSTASIPEIGDLNTDDLTLRLSILDKELKSTPQTFPLQPNIPQVSDILAWISSHPNFISQNPEDSADPSKSMQIQSFNYVVVKRPEPSKKQEKYQVKVEMEFSAPTPKMAREFHDALITPNEIVDSKGEIKWNSNKNLYRTSFYLKDKTIYPNL